MSDQGTTPTNDPYTSKPTGGATWGPTPGDALAPPPTPQAPEIPISRTWPWVAGGVVVFVYGGAAIVALLVLGFILHALFGWF